ncbi:hypothetical protein [Rhodococcus aetherivorans]|uniref:hypothetical protein n=1 Tax=Rhodococcus aetherivorans TaxID=191292 RepID=UPI00045C4C48|nr:hypothetical protein [Rhodococcus aetherivorans]KDE12437.1 hypothetical protein N505_0115425 [Rhodococcus aetherivorans]
MASTSRYPEKFGKSGRELWAEIEDKFTLNTPERLLLKQACRAADRLDEIQEELEGQDLLVDGKHQPITNPLLVEFRQQSQVLAKLLAQLRIPDVPATDDAPRRPQRRGGARGSYAPGGAPLRAVGQ